MATIQISLRTFFTSDEAQIAPQTIVTVDSGDIGKVPWSETIEKLFKQTCGQLEGGPFTNLREMDHREVEAYLTAERNNDGHNI